MMRQARSILFLFTAFISISSYGQDTLFRSSYNSGVSYEGKGLIYELRNEIDTILRYFSGSNVLALKSGTAEGMLDGEVEKYYSNGQLYEKTTYDAGNPVDTIRRWHRNGNFMGKFTPIIGDEEGPVHYEPGRVISFYDTLGNQTVTDGEGRLYLTDPLTGEYAEGNVVRGLKSGSWSGASQKVSYQEEYENGRLIKGVSQDQEGNEYHYDQIEENAGFIGGLPAFYEFLKKHLRYPRLAQRRGVQGRVFIYFIVEKDGSLSNLRIVKGIGAGCDEESIRVLSLSPNWEPGRKRGRVVRQAMMQNLLFKFSN